MDEIPLTGRDRNIDEIKMAHKLARELEADGQYTVAARMREAVDRNLDELNGQKR